MRQFIVNTLIFIFIYVIYVLGIFYLSIVDASRTTERKLESHVPHNFPVHVTLQPLICQFSISSNNCHVQVPKNISFRNISQVISFLIKPHVMLNNFTCLSAIHSEMIFVLTDLKIGFISFLQGLFL